METKTQTLIDENMTVGDVISQWPEVAEIFGKHGLSCIGCSVNTMEAIGVGARGHGMSDKEIASMIQEANDFLAKKEAGEEAHVEGGKVLTFVEPKLTEAAAKKVSELMKSQNKNGFLRFGVAPGGCSGFTYGLEFVESSKPEDIVLEQHGVKLVISKKSMEKVSGAQIDFVDSLQGSGFKITNPQAKSGCGCGKSFS